MLPSLRITWLDFTIAAAFFSGCDSLRLETKFADIWLLKLIENVLRLTGA